MKHHFKPIYLFIFLFFLNSAKAQQILNTTSLSIKNITYIFDAQNESHQPIWVVANNGALQCLERDENNKFVTTGILMVPKHIKKITWKSLAYVGDTLYLTGLDKQNQLYTIYWHKKSKTIFSKAQVMFGFYEHILKTIVTQKAVFFINVTQNKNELKIYTLYKTTIESHVYNVPMNDFHNRLSKQNDLLNDPNEYYYNIDFIDPKIEQNVKSTRAQKKLYQSDSIFAFVFDANHTTEIVYLNFVSHTVEYKKFDAKPVIQYDNKHINSFYQSPYLYQLTINAHQFDVIVWDTKNDKIVQHKSVLNKDTILFKNGNIVEEGIISNQPVGENTATFIRRMNDGYPAIAVTQKDSTNILEIGTFEQILQTSPTPYMGMGMGYGGMGMGYGGMGMGPMYSYNPTIENAIGQYDGFPGYYPYQNTTMGIRSTYFHALFNISTFETIEGIPPISFRERLSRFQFTYFKDDQPEWVHIANLGHEIIVSYYDRKKNTLVSYYYWM